jgi:hypothetical protein
VREQGPHIGLLLSHLAFLRLHSSHARRGPGAGRGDVEDVARAAAGGGDMIEPRVDGATSAGNRHGMISCRSWTVAGRMGIKTLQGSVDAKLETLHQPMPRSY